MTEDVDQFLASEWLREMAAALRVFGTRPEDHEASYTLDRAARLIGDSQVFYPDKEWTDWLTKWRAQFRVNLPPEPTP